MSIVVFSLLEQLVLHSCLVRVRVIAALVLMIIVFLSTVFLRLTIIIVSTIIGVAVVLIAVTVSILGLLWSPLFHLPITVIIIAMALFGVMRIV